MLLLKWEKLLQNALGHREKINFNNIPHAIYTMPEVGTVGLTEEKAREKYDILVGKFPPL